MTDENKIAFEASLSYEQYCRRLSSPGDSDLMYVHDVLGRIGLEVLWLKLALLSEIIILSQATRFDPSLCHIKLLSSATRLPRFWNFFVGHSPVTVDAPVQTVVRELGLCWFTTLLVNPGQTAAEVGSAYTSLLTKTSGNSNQLIESALRSPVFQPTQLFAAKALSKVNAIPAELWQRVLHVGFRLATQIPNFSYVSKSEDALSAVLGRVLTDVEALCAQVATALFIDPPRMEQDLGELINELIRDPQWVNSLGQLSAMPPVAPAPITQPRQASVMQVALPDVEPDMESTIIMKRGATIPSVPAPDLNATVVMATPPPAPAAEDNLEATIIISKDKKR